MVALSGSGWKLAPCLVRLVHDVDARYPKRSRISDGSIGDAAHAARDSFHNPLDGFVDALDLTYDPTTFNAHAFADALVARPPYWMDHVISNKRIASRKTLWKWTPYTGVNPHDHHAHFACQRNTFGRTSPAPWFLDTEDIMTPEQEALLKDIHSELPTIRRLRQVFGTDVDPKELPAGAGVDAAAVAVELARRLGNG